MKYFFAFLIVLLWLITTIVLSLSIVGILVVVIVLAYKDIYWFEIPKKALNVFEDKN
jgi:hypothetical protein